MAGRLPAMLGLMAVLVIAPPFCDLLARRRVHPIDVWGGLMILASFPLTLAIGHTAVWHSFAVWLTR